MGAPAAVGEIVQLLSRPHASGPVGRAKAGYGFRS